LALCLFLGLAHETRSSVANASPGLIADGARLGTVDVLAVVERLISSDKYKTDREANQNAAADKLKPLTEELTKMQEEAKELKEGSETLKALSRSFTEKSNTFQQVRGEITEGVESFNTSQVSEAYRLVTQAAISMADARGYTHLFASKSGSLTITSKNIPGAVQEILARPMLKSVGADDLTETLIKDMKLENVVVPSGAVPAAGAAPMPGAAGSAPGK